MELSNKNYFIYFEPFKDECLYSWNLRMLLGYAEENELTKSSEKQMKMMYGDNITCNDLYFQEGIDHLISKIDSTSACKWETTESVINSMTVFPFYKSFMKEKRFPRYDKLDNQALYYAIGKRIGLIQEHNYIEGRSYIKFCPQCHEEGNARYFKIEHQIPGNFVCSKHKVPLCYIAHESFCGFNAFEFIDCAPTYKLTQMEQITALSISRMIHQIFEEGLRCSLGELKEKIRSCLRSRNILNSNFEFYDYEGFLAEFDYDIYFRYVDKEKVIYNLIYDNQLIINPIFYLVMIDYLFQGLQSFYQYEIEFKHGIVKRKFLVKQEQWDLYSVDFYRESMSDEYKRNYTIIGETSCSLILKHNKCGKYFSIDRRFSSLHSCVHCSDISDNVERDFLEEAVCVPEIDNDPKYTYYLTTKEYAALHNKSKHQILHLLRKGRLPNALRIELGAWIIPRDEKYPVDGRSTRNR